MNYTIYYKTGEHEASGNEYKLVKKALRRYLHDTKQMENMQYFSVYDKIVRTKRGKPYFENADLQFSISHTDGLWVCAFGNAPCGIDAQVYGNYREESISKRLFSPDDVAYAKEKGSKGFYSLWSRFEAVCKCSGEGIFARKPNLSREGVLMDVIESEGVKYWITQMSGENFGLEGNYEISLCTLEPAEIEIRRLDD